ncbi:hydrolytic protein [Kitasatospora sp. NPDC051170]|uniref:hydrolytic protein n=1 Tax=Kitasatospora sp. NPDC051170 TaxID=3364056 RepID=UPI0037873484
MTASASAELALAALTVAPGGTATTTLTVRNDLDIVEAYTLEVVGDCAAWTTVEPARVSLYPGTSETVTVRLAPPRSPEARAGDFPLGVRVLPVEHPELATVPEATVTVLPFRELRAALAPRRRRGWRRARFRATVRNLGNAPITVVFTPAQAGEDLRFRVTPDKLRLEPGAAGEVRVQARARKLIWFGKPHTWPFEVKAGPEAPKDGDTPAETPPSVLDGEFVQLPVFPKWLLALLAALIALLLAWFALVRPAVRSSAKQAAEQAVAQKSAAPAPAPAVEGTPAVPSAGATPGGAGKPAAGQPTPGGRGAGPGAPGGGGAAQINGTIDVQTANAGTAVGSYPIPHGKVLDITDIVVANFQGDQGLLTIKAGDLTITTIALETFRNQDYHWVTPIRVSEDQAVTANVTCESPGTPASGAQAATCHELVNISGTLSDLPRGN